MKTRLFVWAQLTFLEMSVFFTETYDDVIESDALQ